MATANTRAADSDRDDTCRVLDSAFGEGQLSAEEHRERVVAATKATTLGELSSLATDLQVRNAPAQLSKLGSPAGVWGLRIAASVGIVLLGAGIAWAFSGNNPSSPKPSASHGVPSPSQSAAVPTAAPTTKGPAVATTSTKPEAPPEIMTLGGLTRLLAQMHEQVGDTMGYKLNIYETHAALYRPDAANPHKTVEWTYDNTGWSLWLTNTPPWTTRRSAT